MSKKLMLPDRVRATVNSASSVFCYYFNGILDAPTTTSNFQQIQGKVCLRT